MLLRFPGVIAILFVTLLIGSAVYGAHSLSESRLRSANASYDITYIYDELGRLIAVVDPPSDTAVYNYDASGSFLSISRFNSATVSIIRFTPGSGAAGASVTNFRDALTERTV